MIKNVISDNFEFAYVKVFYTTLSISASPLMLSFVDDRKWRAAPEDRKVNVASKHCTRGFLQITPPLDFQHCSPIGVW